MLSHGLNVTSSGIVDLPGDLSSYKEPDQALSNPNTQDILRHIQEEVGPRRSDKLCPPKQMNS